MSDNTAVEKASLNKTLLIIRGLFESVFSKIPTFSKCDMFIVRNFGLKEMKILNMGF
jgi:hypothetical protein